ncbi:MAG: leucine-rich repeat domain-containing protein [Clostridia bacterium]|nr:leucine-rich repeat domain-containing protein [Clostridia bacterium]
MGYGAGTVPYRVTNNADELIDLGKYAGQTVTLVYVAGLADSEKLVEMVEIDVIVPEAIDVPEETTAAPAIPEEPEVSESEGLTFLYNGDGTCSLIGVGDCKDTEIVIPAVSPEGYSVISIGDYAFSQCYDITSVIIPDSVTSIANNAFESCWNLTSVTIPDSVTSIGDSAFAGCWALTSITIPESVTTIGYMTFSDCDSFTNITIPDSVTSIGDSAFNSCDNLTSITIPNSVTYIGVYAFNCCTNLTSITIPNNLTRIGCWAFADCTRLTSAIFENTSGWEISNGTSILSTNLENYSVAATLLKSTYRAYDWTRN